MVAAPLAGAMPDCTLSCMRQRSQLREQQRLSLLKMQLIVFPVFFTIVPQLDRRLQQDSDVSNRRVGKQRAQSFLANDAFTQARVYIAWAAQSHFRIIQVDDVQA